LEKTLSDALKTATTVMVPVKKTWVDDFMAKARGAGTVVADATPRSIKSVGRSVGSVVAEVGEGAILGGLIGAADATFGVDASPAVMGVGMAAAVFLNESHPMVAEVASRAAGQAAAVMAAFRSKKLLGGGGSSSEAPKGLRPIGGAGSLKANGEDPIAAKAKALWGKK
jgi:hypothetical protein